MVRLWCVQLVTGDLPMSLQERIKDDMKTAMRSRDKARLSVIRMLQAAIKQREVDERIELDDNAVLAVLEKMVKQRRDAETQYRDAGRGELAAAEAAEIVVLQGYLPEQLSVAEIDAEIDAVLAATGAASMRDMGKAMGALKPRVQGKADMGEVSQRLKARLQ